MPGGGQRAPLLAAGERPHGERPVCVPADSAPSCLPVAPPPSSLVVGAPAHRAVKMVTDLLRLSTGPGTRWTPKEV